MLSAIKTMVESLKRHIVNDLADIDSEKSERVLRMVLDAYNDYQESRLDGVGYIFDINNSNDLVCCLKGGMSVKEVSELYTGSQVNHLQYFYFGCNYPTPKPISNWQELRNTMIDWLDDLLVDVVTYPSFHKSYETIYTFYVAGFPLN